jgi:hypothetical protein
MVQRQERVLNQHQFGHYCCVLLPLRFFLALLVGGALARGDLVECAPLCFHPHVGITREHGARDVPRDAHDHLVACARS